MDDAFDRARSDYEREVRNLAAEMVNAGECAPFDAIKKAHKHVQMNRRTRAHMAEIARLSRGEG